MGRKISHTQIELSDEEIGRVASTYRAWRGRVDEEPYSDVAGFCRTATLGEIAAAGHVLAPGRFVGFTGSDEDDGASGRRLTELTSQLQRRARDGAELDRRLARVMRAIGYEP